jgi:hypothetical protein
MENQVTENQEVRDGLAGGDDNNVEMPLQEVVRQVHDELRQLLQQRIAVTHRIRTLKQTAAGLAATFGDDLINVDLRRLVSNGGRVRAHGLTKMCRAILMEAARPLGAGEVRNRVQERAATLLAAHKDPVASITTILNRLVEYGEARRTVSSDNRRAWQWAGGNAGSGQTGASQNKDKLV